MRWLAVVPAKPIAQSARLGTAFCREVAMRIAQRKRLVDRGRVAYQKHIARTGHAKILTLLTRRFGGLFGPRDGQLPSAAPPLRGSAAPSQPVLLRKMASTEQKIRSGLPHTNE